MSLSGTQQGWSSADNYANNTHTRNSAMHSRGTSNNHNHGSGVFNNVIGTQNNTYVTLGPSGGSLAQTGIDLDIQPYKSIIHSLEDIERRLEAFTQSPSVKARRKQVDNFRRMVVCVGKAMEIIHHDYPQLVRHPFFHTIDAQALDYGQSLEQLKEDISRYRDKLFAAMEHGLQYSTDEWIRSLSPQLKHLISNNQALLTRFLHVLLK
ncbi:hypothetical protein EYR40_002543 [Pleurotus pulmonarius]|nr:hypothetical protein EYR40_002543 [Pleurotus pulmonarius]